MTKSSSGACLCSMDTGGPNHCAMATCCCTSQWGFTPICHSFQTLHVLTTEQNRSKRDEVSFFCPVIFSGCNLPALKACLTLSVKMVVEGYHAWRAISEGNISSGFFVALWPELLRSPSKKNCCSHRGTGFSGKMQCTTLIHREGRLRRRNHMSWHMAYQI